MSGIGVDIPQDAYGAADGERVRHYCREAEAAGFDGLWVTDSSAAGVLSPLVTLAFAAAATTRVRLGVAVLLSALQAPLRLARDLASLDRLSAGRLEVGVAIGADGGTYARHGLQVHDRPAHFESNVSLLRRLLRDERITDEGPWWPMRDQPRPMAPIQKPTPPLWFGARRSAALERAVRMGDGWIGAGSMRREDFEDALRTVHAHLRSAQRDPRSFAVAKRVYVYVGAVTGATEAALQEWFRGHYGDAELASRVMVAGPVGDVVGHLTHLRAIGVGTLVLHPVLDHGPQMQQLARDVLPQIPEQSFGPVHVTEARRSGS